jgi:predicted dehydrogenase
MADRKRYAIVGMGGRVVMYTDAVVGKYKDRAELVGICDTSQVRMGWHNRRMKERFGLAAPVPTYHASNFAQMIRETKAEVVVVTTPDAFHHEYAIAAMELGCDVICEKPVTTDAEKLNALFAAVGPAVDAGCASWGGLFPAVASRQAHFRRAFDPQGVASF